MPLYEYKCETGHLFDDFSSVAERNNKECPDCAGKARTLISAVRLDYYRMGTDSSLPTAWDKWAKMHEKEAKRKSD
jgi:putative FmdB family regulatory protein